MSKGREAQVKVTEGLGARSFKVWQAIEQNSDLILMSREAKDGFRKSPMYLAHGF